MTARGKERELLKQNMAVSVVVQLERVRKVFFPEPVREPTRELIVKDAGGKRIHLYLAEFDSTEAEAADATGTSTQVSNGTAYQHILVQCDEMIAVTWTYAGNICTESKDLFFFLIRGVIAGGWIYCSLLQVVSQKLSHQLLKILTG